MMEDDSNPPKSSSRPSMLSTSYGAMETGDSGSINEVPLAKTGGKVLKFTAALLLFGVTACLLFAYNKHGYAPSPHANFYEIDQCVDMTSKKIACCASTKHTALGGIDLVALYQCETGCRPPLGSQNFEAEYTLGHNSYTFFFQSDENRVAFLEDPATYLPAFGGFCAYQIATDESYQQPYGQYNLGPAADLIQWEMIDGKVYFFGGVSEKIKFHSAQPENLRAGFVNWQKWFGTRETVIMNTNCYTNTMEEKLKPVDVSLTGWDPFVH